MINTYILFERKIEKLFSLKGIQNNNAKMINIELIPEDVDRVSVVAYYFEDTNFQNQLDFKNFGYLDKKNAKIVTHINNQKKEKEVLKKIANIIQNKLKKENINLDCQLILTIHDGLHQYQIS